MAENGMTANDIANALTMAMSLSDPDNKGNCCRVLGPNLKKSPGKKIRQIKLIKKLIFREITFLGSFKLFPSSKIAFWPFFKLHEIEFSQNFISRVFWPGIF